MAVWVRGARARVLLMIPTMVVAAAVGCQRQPPPVTETADRIAEIVEVNTAGEYVDTVAVAPDGSRVAIAERSGPVKLWALPDPTEPVTLGQRRQRIGTINAICALGLGQWAAGQRRRERVWTAKGRRQSRGNQGRRNRGRRAVHVAFARPESRENTAIRHLRPS